MKNFSKNNKGFSLVETLVAIFILAMALTSAMAVAQSSLMASFFSRDRITAYFLAQEAVEIIKNIRDENRLENRDSQNTSWSSGIIDLDCDEEGECGVDINDNSIKTCVQLNGCRLKRDTDDGIFNHINGDDTRFTREIVITGIDDLTNPRKEIKITVTVSWPQALNQNKKFVMTEHIFNWLSFGG